MTQLLSFSSSPIIRFTAHPSSRLFRSLFAPALELEHKLENAPCSVLMLITLSRLFRSLFAPALELEHKLENAPCSVLMLITLKANGQMPSNLDRVGSGQAVAAVTYPLVKVDRRVQEFLSSL